MQNVPAVAVPLDPLFSQLYLHKAWNESHLPAISA